MSAAGINPRKPILDVTDEDWDATMRINLDAPFFMAQALARPLADAPDAPERALGQVERAISETLAHHAQVRLMPAVGRLG